MKTLSLAVTVLALLASDASAAEYAPRCARVLCDAHDGIMTYRGKFALVSVNPSRYRFTYACWRIFDTLAEAKAAQRGK